MPTPIASLLKSPAGHLAGTDLHLRLPLGRALLNEVLAARPADTPVEELYVDPDPGNQLHLHLAATAPVVGLVKRRITFVPGPPVTFPDQPWLHLDIIDGFKFLDKPLIRLLGGQIEERMPKGVEFTSKYLRLHVPALLTKAGYQQFVPLLRKVELKSEDNFLVVNVNFRS